MHSRSITAVLAALSLVGTLCLGAEDPAGTAAASTNGEPDYLFVQTARAGHYDGQRLTLEDVSSLTLFFTHKPRRMAGQITTRHFFQNWEKGSLSFAAEPPQATLSILDEHQLTNIVIEITAPVLEGPNLSFEAKAVSGDLPSEFGSASIFYDTAITGQTAVLNEAIPMGR